MADTDPNAVHLQTAHAPVPITPEVGNLSITGTVYAQGGFSTDPAAAAIQKYRPGLFLPDGALDNWYAAKKTAATTQVPVVAIGDSIFEGISAGDLRSQAAMGLLSAHLQSLYGAAGETIGPSESLAIGGASIPAGNRYWTLAGTWALWNTSAGMLGWSALGSGGNTDTATFVPPTGLVYQDFDILVHQEPTGTTFTVTVDGAAKTADGGVGTQTYLNASYARHVAVPFSGFAATGHTVVVTAAGGGTKSLLAGITVYPNGRNAPGVIFHRLNLAGRTAAIFKPFWPSIHGAYDGAAASITDFNPKLVLIEFGINDMNTFTSLSAFAYCMMRACQAAQNAGASIIIVGCYVGAAFGAVADSWGMYLEEMYTLARAYNAVLLDLHSAWGANPQGAGLVISADQTHPTVAGHLDMYNRLIGIL